MTQPSTKAVVVTLLLVGAAVSSGALFLDGVLDDRWSENGVVVQPAPGPNGDYAGVGTGGQVTVAIDEPGVNPQSLTIVRRVFVARNTGGNWTRVWVTAPGSPELSVVDERTGDSILGADNGTVLGPGDRVLATLRIDTRSNETASGDALLHELTVHTEPTSRPPPKRAPTTVTITTTEDTPNGGSQVFSVDFGPEVGRANITVEPLDADALGGQAAPANATPRPAFRVVNRSTQDGVEVNGTAVDAVVPARRPVQLDASRSVVPTTAGVDSERRVAAAFDVAVPRSLRDESATLRFRLPRGRFDGTDPGKARIAHRTPGGWELLDTQVVETTSSTVVLEARTPGFSRFAVFTNPGVTTRWRLPDDRTATGPRVRTTFDDPGLHPVSLAVRTDQGVTAVARRVVLANDQPRVAVSRPANVSAGDSVTLDATVTDRYGNTSVTWDLPNGGTATGRSVVYAFEPGTHEVTVHVTDEYGATVSQTEVVRVAGQSDGWSTPYLPIEDLGVLGGTLIGFTFLQLLVVLLVLFATGRIRVGDPEDDVLVAAFRGESELGNGLEDTASGVEGTDGLFDRSPDVSTGTVLDAIIGREAAARASDDGDAGAESDTDARAAVDSGLATLRARLATAGRAALAAVATAMPVPLARTSGRRPVNRTLSLPSLRRARGPEVTEFRDPTWDPERNRFVIGTLAVSHPECDLATVEITIVDGAGDPLARKTVDLRGQAGYRASPELVPGIPEAEVAGTGGFAARIRVVDSRANEATVHQSVRMPHGVTPT